MDEGQGDMSNRTIAFFNHRSGKGKSDAQKIDEFFNTKLGKESQILRLNDPRIQTDGSTIFVHTDTEALISFWLPLTKKHPATDFIFMSTDPPSLAPYISETQCNACCCEHPAHVLAEYGEVSEFLAAAASGRRISEIRQLLKRKASTEWLVAAYILLLARKAKVIGNETDLGPRQYMDALWHAAGSMVCDKPSVLPTDTEAFLQMDSEELDSAIAQIRLSLSGINRSV